MTTTLRAMPTRAGFFAPRTSPIVSPHHKDNVLRLGAYAPSTLQAGPYTSALVRVRRAP